MRMPQYGQYFILTGTGRPHSGQMTVASPSAARCSGSYSFSADGCAVVSISFSFMVLSVVL